MIQESHPWLMFSELPRGEKNYYLTKLVEIRGYAIEAPRTIDWAVLESLGIAGRIRNMLTAQYHRGSEVISYPIWDRVFRLNRDVSREQCLEFFSSFQFEKNLRDSVYLTKKVIHFRAGGRLRHCTLAEFAYLTGMMTRDELESEDAHHFLLHGATTGSGFDDNLTAKEYWTQISGLPTHHSNTSKVAAIRSPILRVFHKMLTYSFLHRSNQNDKVYVDDLRILRLFAEGAPTRYACAPYYLAEHMARHNERKILCGHFVAQIFRRLGVDDTAQTRRFNNAPIPMRIIGNRDLQMSRLLNAEGNALIPDPDDEESSEEEEEAGNDEEMEHDAPPPPPHSAYDFSSWGTQLEALTNAQQSNAEYNRLTQESLRRIEESTISYHHDARATWGRFEQQQRYFGSRLDELSYGQDYLRDYIEHTHVAPPDSSWTPPVYQPPDLFVPDYSRTYDPYLPGTSSQGPANPQLQDDFDPTWEPPRNNWSPYGRDPQQDGDGTSSIWPAWQPNQ